MKLLKQAKTLLLTAYLGCLIASNSSGESINDAIRPISNLTQFDLPITQTYLHPVYLNHRLPSKVNTTIGGLPMGGDINIYALAFEYAINDKFSIVASKDGYIDFNPDSTFKSESGFADVTGGIKWAFYQNEAKDFAVAAKLLIDLPLGDDDVFQGNGKGSLFPSINFTKMYDKIQVSGVGGFSIPLDSDEESALFFHSWHVSYALTNAVRPLIELTHYRVINEGSGNSNFAVQAGGAVPAVAKFEGGDLINLGAGNAEDSRDFLTIAVGARFRMTENIDFGVAYEIPLTDDEESLTESRTTIDMIYHF